MFCPATTAPQTNAPCVHTTQHKRLTPGEPRGTPLHKTCQGSGGATGAGTYSRGCRGTKRAAGTLKCATVRSRQASARPLTNFLPTQAEVIVIVRDDLPPTPDWHHVNRDPVTVMPLRFEGDDG